MTYPPGGYPPAQQPGSYGASTSAAPAAGTGESQLPLYLKIGVAALGLVVYLASFGPATESDHGPSIPVGGSWPVALALLAALLIGLGVLPKAKDYTPIAAAAAVLGALLAISSVLNGLLSDNDTSSVGVGLWLVLAFTVIQAGVAVAALLFDAGVITPPAPKPQYAPHQQPYGAAPGGYYGQPGQAPAPYGGYPPAPGAPSLPPGPASPPAGGFGGPPAPQGQPQHAPHDGPPTPPTGFPSFSPPPGPDAGDPGQQPSGPAQP